MRRYSKGLLGVAFLIICVIALVSMSCSWEIFTQGEIQKEAASIEEALEILPLPVIEILTRFPGTDDIPDSVQMKVWNTYRLDGMEVPFVEMEVGELLEGQGGDPDTIVVDHRP